MNKQRYLLIFEDREVRTKSSLNEVDMDSAESGLIRLIDMQDFKELVDGEWRDIICLDEYAYEEN